MMNSNTQPAVSRCLRSVWWRAQQKHTICGLLAFVRWFVPLFLAAILIDRFAYLPSWARALLALALILVTVSQAWRRGWNQLRRFNAGHAARQIELSRGGMDSLLVTAVHFQQLGPSPGTSTAMWEHTRRKAEEATASVEVRHVVSMADLRRPLRIFLALAVALLIGIALQGAFLGAGFGRLFTPWREISYPTKTRIHLGTGELIVKEGAPAKVEIRFSGDVIPKTAKLSLLTGRGRPRELVLDVIHDVCTYEIASASRDFTYRVKAGDARSDWRQVRVIPAPRLANVNVELDFPDYIDRANEGIEALTLTIPEQTKVRWSLTLDTPIRSATLHRDGAEDLPLVIGADGCTLTLEEIASASRGYSFSWTEKQHGFEYESPRYFLQVASDQPPRVELVAPEGNLNAMLGRPLQLTTRCQDDHGIGASTIIYKVNLRPETAVTLDPPLRNGGGEQPIDWDYRKVITDLQVGDTVSFTVEVADKYPGESGVHRARSESRRITFLSREDYLAGVTKQMERLLNRVRALYRQEREAHGMVIGLDPASESFVPTCQLEAIRQEMIREHLVTTAGEVQALLDDLAANQVGDAVESEALTASRDVLRAISSNHVARAADLLRAQVGAKDRDPLPAIAAVNQAARELALLVQLRGIDASREVFARETFVIADDLARLRLRLLNARPEQGGAIASEHEELAAWTMNFLDRLMAGMRYDKRPLAVLGLSRRIHEIRVAGVAGAMRKAATLAREGKTGEAAAAQYPAIRPLIEAGFTMRAGSEYALIRRLREQLARLITSQQDLMTTGTRNDFASQAPDLALRQASLRDQLVLALLPGIPAAHARLDDLRLPEPPPVDGLRLNAEALMGEAIGHLQARAAEQADNRQREALGKLKQLDVILERWGSELSQLTIGASAKASDAMERVGLLEQLENRQLLLLEQTEEAALDAKEPKSILDDQQSIGAELEAFNGDIVGQDGSVPGGLLPLHGRVAAAVKAVRRAGEALSQHRMEDALQPQEEAAAAITEARQQAQSLLLRINLLQQLVGFEMAVASASQGIRDIVDTQIDLTSATKGADEKQMPALIKSQQNLRQCLVDIAPSLDLVAARLDVGTPLVFAGSDLEDALAAMEDNEGGEAADVQDIAVNSLTKVQSLVSAISGQTGYVAEIVERLQEAQAEASMLAYRQRQLRGDSANPNALSSQKAIQADAEAYGRALLSVAGKVDPAGLPEEVKLKLGDANLAMDFSAPAFHMAEALRLMEAGQPTAEAMLAAEQALDSISGQVNVIIEMLNGLPGLGVTKESLPEIKRLVDILDVASRHRAQLRRAQVGDAAQRAAIAADQQKLVQALGKAVENGRDHPLLSRARAQLAQAGVKLSDAPPAPDEGLRAQLLADQELRHFIIEQALILNTAPVMESGGSSDVVTEAETDDLSYQTETVGFVADFVSGETPKDKKTEWEFLGTRNRAALNQNFARELPLEFRATLKNYYEKVAK